MAVDPASASAAGLLGLGVLMILTGRLIPRALYLDVIRERDQWREVALKSAGHTDALLPAAQISAEAMRALSEQASPAPARALAGESEPR